MKLIIIFSKVCIPSDFPVYFKVKIILPSLLPPWCWLEYRMIADTGGALFNDELALRTKTRRKGTRMHMAPVFSYVISATCYHFLTFISKLCKDSILPKYFFFFCHSCLSIMLTNVYCLSLSPFCVI